MPAAKITELPPALKTTFSFILIQFALFFTIVVPSSILMRKFAYGRGDQELASYVYNGSLNFDIHAQIALPAPAFTGFTWIFGIIAVLYWKHRTPSFGLMITFVVFQLIVMAYSLTVGGIIRNYVPKACNEIKSDCDQCNWDVRQCCLLSYENYELHCFIKPKANLIASISLLINGGISLGAIISGSISAKIIKLRPKNVK